MMSGLDRGFVVQAGGGETFWVGASPIRVMAGEADTARAMTIMEALLPAGFRTNYHVHLNEDELFYVLEGKLLARCGQDIWLVEEGGLAFFPKGIPHSPGAAGGQPATVLAITVPGGFEKSLLEAGGRSRGEFDAARFLEASRRNGMEAPPSDFQPPDFSEQSVT
jgi:quercetin dioxygenase-like cupin family protein